MTDEAKQLQRPESGAGVAASSGGKRADGGARRRRSVARLLVMPRVEDDDVERPVIRYAVVNLGNGRAEVTFDSIELAEAFVAGAVWTGRAESVVI